MSIQKKFDRAVEIVGGLPKEGSLKPTTDDQLTVSSDVLSLTLRSSGMTVSFLLSVLQVL